MNEKHKKTAKNIATNVAYVSLFAALIAVCTWISFPFASGIAVTLQTFAVILAAALLGWKRGTLSVLIYIALGAVGVPVFSGFRGGLSVLGGVTGGYIVGFIFTALLVGIVCEKTKLKTLPMILSMAAGILVCYAFGTAWFCIYFRGAKTIGYALLTCVVPYIPFDAIKVALACLIAKRLYGKIGS